MNFNHDLGLIDTILTLDTTESPPLGGLVNSLQVLGSGALYLPFGNTAARPANSVGMIRYNTQTSVLEVNTGATWISYVNRAGDTMSGALAMGGFNITGLPTTPSGADSATSKAYVDATAQGLSVKPSAIAATTAGLPAYTYAPGTLGVGATLTGSATGTLTIDTHLVAFNDIILVKNETAANAPYNGLYVCTIAGAIGVNYELTRHVDMDQTGEFAGAFIFVESGFTNTSTGWFCTVVGNITVGGASPANDVTFTQFSGAGTYVGTANQITLTGNAFSLSTTIITPGSFTASPSNANVVLSPTGTGIVTINPATLGSINNVTVGATTASTGRFTTVESTIATGTAPFTVASTTQVANLNVATAGTATNTTITDDNSTAATMYPTWVTANTGNLPQKVSSTKLTFNPNTATLTTTTFSGALSGNATTATTATNANNSAITAVSTNATFYPTFVSTTTGNLPIDVDTDLTYNPSTNVLTLPSTGNMSAGTLTSTVTTGTAPLTVTSTTQVANLNVSQLEGKTWEVPGTIGSTTPNTGAFTTLSSNAGNTISRGNFVSAGDAQSGTYILRNSTTNNTATELFLDGASTRLVLPNNSAFTFFILVTARRTDAVGGAAGYTFTGVITKDTTAASTTLIGGVSKTVQGETDSGWNATLTADTTNGSIKIEVVGQNAKTIRWVATVITAEVTN